MMLSIPYIFKYFYSKSKHNMSARKEYDIN